MAGRRRSRILALQFLFVEDLNAWEAFDQELKLFAERYHLSPDEFPHFFTLVRGVFDKLYELNNLILGHSKNWKMTRMSGVDRNLMRIAVYEMLYCDDVPSTVAINEAIEVAKRFSTEDAGAFINGVLDGISKTLALP
ncbi:MAG: transcription antitermination factor NusB [Desulfosudaceae bacterium]